MSIHRLCIYNLLYISKWKTIYIHLIEDDAIHLKQQRIQFIKHAWNSCIHSKYFRLAVFVEWKRQFGLFCLAKDKNSSSFALWRRHVANELCAEWLNYATYISVALPGTFNIDFNLIPFRRCARSHANNFVKATKVLLRFSIVIFIFFFGCLNFICHFRLFEMAFDLVASNAASGACFSPFYIMCAWHPISMSNNEIYWSGQTVCIVDELRSKSIFALESFQLWSILWNLHQRRWTRH